MAYNELIKNFEKVRAYMREFYVYGFKSRTEYDAKSARSYDDERRRLESWLGDYMRFTQTPEGKNVFLSVDSRVTRKNPFYKAWKAKSFTDGDITLHFAIFDILYDPETKMTLTELIEEIDQRLLSRVESARFVVIGDPDAAARDHRDGGDERLCRRPVARDRVGHRHARADERAGRSRTRRGARA